ncbi:putative extracellular serine carboxypeptidase [Purpureocillium lavendulum]|uniref:Extracellular serine carboxypeptidase n=1 Tax=Purpureocillium lavendulum TaxID=1247861 RepID=A0AB34FAZ7_9HYPO|nr:putative extracellular serine carboxypeptidase [Purpureocillium lavendulum]
MLRLLVPEMRLSVLAIALTGSMAPSSGMINRRQLMLTRQDNDGIAPTAGLFDQLIDHNHPELGTFKQRFWWNAQYYGGPGFPIILEAPGEFTVREDDLDHSNSTLTGLLAQTNRAGMIILEHRYWGSSSPVGKNFTSENLQHLNLDNAMQDLIYFAKNVYLPFDPCGNSKPDKAPWVLTGCSYPGALTAWTNLFSPGTFWAYHASSAVVEIISTFWQYFSPVEQAMPRNCSADFKKIIAHVDDVLFKGSPAEKAKLKSMFNMTDSVDDEFAGALSDPLGDWQDVQFTTDYSNFSRMCDYIEVCSFDPSHANITKLTPAHVQNQWPESNITVSGAEGIGVERALKGFAKWMEIRRPLEGAKLSTDDADDVLWRWMLCNEPFEFWQVWGPGCDNGLVSKAYNRSSSLAQCKKEFPDTNGFTYGLNKDRTVEQVNAKIGGWTQVNTTRLMWVNGEYDPWRPATVSSTSRPGGPLKSTKEAPVWVIPKAAHCNDYRTANRVNEGAREAIDGVVKQMKEWVAEFYKRDGVKQPREFLS